MRGFAGMGLALPAVIPYLAVIFVSAAVPTPGMAGSLDLASKYALTGLFAVPGQNRGGLHHPVPFPAAAAMPIALGLLAFWQRGPEFQDHRPPEEKR